MKYRMGFGALAISVFASSGASGMQLDVNSPDSIKSAASKVAGGLVGHWFKGEQAAITAGFEVPEMWFWWEAGELWTGLVNYWSYTGDSTYLSITHQYLQAQIGSSQDYMLESHKSDEANDDQAHWGFAAMTAAEKNFPQPDSGPAWLQSVGNLWNFQAAQWDTTACGGGLRWGIEADDDKYDYKNSITNGAFFQLSARLALHTEDAKYTDWAQKVFDWARNTGLVTGDYKVLDGFHVATCKDFSTQRWSINHGIFLYGAAVMYKQTGSDVWKQHTDGLLNAASAYYFNSPGSGSMGPIMWEPDCDPGVCDEDMKIFKGPMARYMYETAVVAPHTASTVFDLLGKSASGAANACTGEGGSLCGSKWYVGDDGAYGPGSQLSALEVIQGLLLKTGAPPPSSTSTAQGVATGSVSSPPEGTPRAAEMESLVGVGGMKTVSTPEVLQTSALGDVVQGQDSEATTPASSGPTGEEDSPEDSSPEHHSSEAASQEGVPCGGAKAATEEPSPPPSTTPSTIPIPAEISNPNANPSPDMAPAPIEETKQTSNPSTDTTAASIQDPKEASNPSAKPDTHRAPFSPAIINDGLKPLTSIPMMFPPGSHPHYSNEQSSSPSSSSLSTTTCFPSARPSEVCSHHSASSGDSGDSGDSPAGSGGSATADSGDESDESKPEETEGSKPQTKFSSDDRTGPGFALLVFCGVVGVVGVVFG